MASLALTTRRHFPRFTFVQKLAGAAALVALADWLFFLPLFGQRIGSTLGLFAMALLLVLVLTRPVLRRGAAPAALAAACVYAAALVEDPSPLAAALFWAAVSLAVLLPRRRFDDGWRWAKRLVLLWVTVPAGPVEDAWRLRAARHRAGSGGGFARLLPSLWLPLIGTLLFLALFASANPLIEAAFHRVDLAAVVAGLSWARIAFWLVAAILVWSLIRPRRVRLLAQRPAGDWVLPGFTLASVTLSLLAFNLVFALENGLDLAFLWSGARLPEGQNFAEYAHRGAYPLIATALLAGLFVLVTLRPGSQFTESPAIRRLVYLWIGQNVLLVASTILRTLNYVDAYSLTILRIAALLWMGLVGIGLVLICLRIALRRSGAWLINANFVAAIALLTACAFVDLGSVAARWNVGHSREVGGRGVWLDLCYLNGLDASALGALVALESRPLPPLFRGRVQWTRNLIMDRLETDQADWRGWTWRGERRLDLAERLVAARHLPRVHADRRACDGNPLTLPA